MRDITEFADAELVPARLRKLEELQEALIGVINDALSAEVRRPIVLRTDGDVCRRIHELSLAEFSMPDEYYEDLVMGMGGYDDETR